MKTNEAMDIYKEQREEYKLDVFRQMIEYLRERERKYWEEMNSSDREAGVSGVALATLMLNEGSLTLKMYLDFACNREL